MDKEYLKLFYVPVQISETKLNVDSLIEFCYEMKRKDEKGIELSNIGGWHSDNVVNENQFSEFVKLKTVIEEAANIYHHEMIQLKKTHTQKISNIWVNINQKGHLNGFHDHPGACISGAFYLTKNKTPIVFQHPMRKHINTYFWGDPIVEEWNAANSGKWTIFPKPNILLVFPAWVQHSVSMNNEDTDRISLSFNTEIRHSEYWT